MSGAPARRKSTALQGPTSLSSHFIFHAISSHCASPFLPFLPPPHGNCVRVSRAKLVVTSAMALRRTRRCAPSRSIIHKNTNFLLIRRERLVYFFDLIRANIILIASMKATGIVNRRKYCSAETVVAL